MGWQRFNRSTNVFEVSDNNGATWQTLVIAAAGLGTPALPATLAYQNQVNTFSIEQDFTGGTGTAYNSAPIEIRTTLTPRLSFHWPGVVASQIGMDSSGNIRTYDNPGTGYAPFAASTLFSNVAGSSLSDLTVRGAAAIGATLNVTGVLSTGTNVVIVGQLRQGLDPPNGTGIYTWFLESSNHIRAAGGLYDYSRGNPIGTWTDFSPSLGGATLVTNYSCKYCLIGKTMIVSLYLNTSSSGTNTITITIPGGFTVAGGGAGYVAAAMAFQDTQTFGNGILQCIPGGNVINVYKLINASQNWVGTVFFCGEIAIPIA